MDSTTITIIVVIAVGLKYLIPYVVKFGEPEKISHKSEWEYKVKFAKLNEELYEKSTLEEKEDLLYYFIQKLRQTDNYGDASFQSMSKTLQVVYLIDDLNDEVNNGGFLQFFTNSSGRYTLETVEALDLVGAKHTKSLLEEAIQIIQKHNTSPEQLNDKLNQKNLREIITFSDFYDNQELMDEMGKVDTKFFESLENTAKLKMDYVEEHKKELWEALNGNKTD